VAKLANVSPSTVSRVISNNSRISEETKKTVNEAMKTLGYHPNAIARSLVNKSTHTIGVIMPKSAHLSLSNPFFPEALRGISARANQKGFYVMLSVEDNEMDKHSNIENIVRAGVVDGVIMLYSRLEDKTFNMLKDNKFPFVVVGKPVNGNANKVNYVDNDNIGAAYDAVTHLINKGRSTIGLITGPLNLVVSLDRLEGYKRALGDSSISYNPDWVQESDFSQEGGYKAMENLLLSGSCPRAILATDDLLALGAIKAIKKAGLKIPDDVAVISFNNIPAAEFLTPSLTSVDINPFDLGYEATELLFQCLEGKKTSSQARIVPTKLIVRESC
jgi:DNA-binding LacI/PurR family transcriptional regulator